MYLEPPGFASPASLGSRQAALREGTGTSLPGSTSAVLGRSHLPSGLLPSPPSWLPCFWAPSQPTVHSRPWAAGILLGSRPDQGSMAPTWEEIQSPRWSPQGPAWSGPLGTPDLIGFPSWSQVQSPWSRQGRACLRAFALTVPLPQI